MESIINTRVLVLVGGGSKAFFPLGILKQIESIENRPLCESFDFINVRSSGALKEIFRNWLGH